MESCTEGIVQQIFKFYVNDKFDCGNCLIVMFSE